MWSFLCVLRCLAQLHNYFSFDDAIFALFHLFLELTQSCLSAFIILFCKNKPLYIIIKWILIIPQIIMSSSKNKRPNWSHYLPLAKHKWSNYMSLVKFKPNIYRLDFFYFHCGCYPYLGSKNLHLKITQVVRQEFLVSGPSSLPFY